MINGQSPRRPLRSTVCIRIDVVGENTQATASRCQTRAGASLLERTSAITVGWHSIGPTGSSVFAQQGHGTRYLSTVLRMLFGGIILDLRYRQWKSNRGSRDDLASRFHLFHFRSCPYRQVQRLLQRSLRRCVNEHVDDNTAQQDRYRRQPIDSFQTAAVFVMPQSIVFAAARCAPSVFVFTIMSPHAHFPNRLFWLGIIGCGA